MSSSRALGLLLGHLADRLLGDPARLHPVAGFGTVAAALERRTYADSRARGTAHALLLVGATVALGALLERRTRGGPVVHTLATAAVTWTVLGGASLGREAAAVEALLADGDLPAARRRLTHLVGRDTTGLDVAGVSRAVVESVAENTVDAVTATIMWGQVAGPVGACLHRAVNTLDAMVGHRSPRYERFGWASARLDDVLGAVPARATALAVAAARPRRAGAVLRAVRSDAGRHPSPNGGVVEAAFAAALGVTLGGVNRYDDRVEHRGLLGTGPSPGPADIVEAVRLGRRVSSIVAVGPPVLALGLRWVVRRPVSGR